MSNLGIDWKKFVIFLIITGGLLYLTSSFFMSLGIVLLRFVLEHFVMTYVENKKRKHNDK